jgi:colanic acid/amylovoran biosynthesis protein
VTQASPNRVINEDVANEGDSARIRLPLRQSAASSQCQQPIPSGGTAYATSSPSETGDYLRVSLLGASFSTGNRGVSALTASTIAAAKNSLPTAQIFLLDYAREPAAYSVPCQRSTATVMLVNLRFSKRFLLRNNIVRLLMTAMYYRLAPWSRWSRAWSKRNPYLQHMLETNLFASVAGGDSFSDVYGLVRLLYVALPQVLVLLLGKPLVLLPQTVGPFRSRAAKMMARYILRRAQKVYTRDSESLEEIKSLVGPDPDRYQISFDMAFVLEPIQPCGESPPLLQRSQTGRPLIGFNVSGLLWMGGYTGVNMFGLKNEYRETARVIIRFLVGQGADVLLIPHVYGTGPETESDLAASVQVYQELRDECEGRLHLLTHEYDHQELKYIIGRCDFFLGSRMHTCIAALSQCVPAVGLAYSRKFAGVFETIGVQDLVADLRERDTKSVLELIAKAYEQREKIRGRLMEKIPQVKSAVLNLFCAGLRPKCQHDLA